MLKNFSVCSTSFFHPTGTYVWIFSRPYGSISVWTIRYYTNMLLTIDWVTIYTPFFFIYRITLNTDKNLLVLSFDPPNWDYTLESDKVPSLVPYSSYADAPIRPREYSYIRACRMKKAGATNTKILQRKRWLLNLQL
jgi:hypothetical protein